MNGADTNPGTSGAPFASLERARDAVRMNIAAGLTHDVLVQIQAGTYLQPTTLIFEPADSGTAKYSITYAAAPHAAVTLSGGRRIRGWQKGPGQIWTASLPEVQAGNWYFRQLFVDGRRATRARTPNAGMTDGWWQITSSTATKENPPAREDPLTIKVNGHVESYRRPGDVELVYMQNNECGRKRLSAADEAAQTFTLAPPHRWNPKVFAYDWYLSIPFAGKPCYLENALEMLDEPGEWYLDRVSGVIYYWPRPGEDLTNAEVVAPFLHNTMVAFAGTRQQPITNVHFEGLQLEYVDWVLPPEGYMAMFCCNVATEGAPPGHRPIEAAVEFGEARNCSVANGAIRHVGGMGLCLREGTSDITVDGNEISDLGGGGIAAGWTNVAAGYLDAARAPGPGEFNGYHITNNHVHHCGSTLYGAVGILLMTSHGALVAHNLIHDVAYIGIAVAGSQDPRVTFDGDNVIEYNHIHDSMATTVDGGGIYITFAHHGAGTLVRGNLIHDIAVGKGRVPSAGLYLDGNCAGCRFEGNVIYRNDAAGPLIFDYPNAKRDNRWKENLIQSGGSPPIAMEEWLQAATGPAAAYRGHLFHRRGNDEKPQQYVLAPGNAETGATVVQFDLSAGERGVVQIVVPAATARREVRVRLRGLAADDEYEFEAYHARIEPQRVWGGPGVIEQMPMLDAPEPDDLDALGITRVARGDAILAQDILVTPGNAEQVVWIAYRKTFAARRPR